MRILHVTKKYPNAIGGDAVVVSNLVKLQQVKGDKVTVLTSNCDQITNNTNIYKFGLKDTSAGLDKITLKRVISLMFLFFTAFRLLKEKRPNVIHTHAIDMAFAVSFAARYYKIPVIHTFHIVTFYYKQQSLLRRRSEIFLAKCTRPAVITAPNNFDVMKLEEAGLTYVKLIPNGIDLEYWRKINDKQKRNVFTFISVGRLEEQKGFNYLIEASKLLKQTSSNFKIILIGEGSERNNLYRLTLSLGVQDNIVFAGQQPEDQVRKFYSLANAAVFPSLWETTPLTLLEAWAMEVPTVITRVGILKGTDNFDDCVVIAKSCDKQSLAEAMRTVMSDPITRQGLSTAGLAKVKNFTWSEIYANVSRLYEHALLPQEGGGI